MKKTLFLIGFLLVSFVLLHAQQPYASYYENGQKKVQGNRDGDKKLGEWTYYYDNGAVMKKGVYQEGSPVGEWIEYWKNGQEKMVGSFVRKDGKSFKHGDWAWYHKNGAQKMSGEYRGGKKVGVWKEYNTLGIEIKKVTY